VEEGNSITISQHTLCVQYKLAEGVNIQAIALTLFSRCFTSTSRGHLAALGFHATVAQPNQGYMVVKHYPGLACMITDPRDFKASGTF